MSGYVLGIILSVIVVGISVVLSKKISRRRKEQKYREALQTFVTFLMQELGSGTNAQRAYRSSLQILCPPSSHAEHTDSSRSEPLERLHRDLSSTRPVEDPDTVLFLQTWQISQLMGLNKVTILELLSAQLRTRQEFIARTQAQLSGAYLTIAILTALPAISLLLASANGVPAVSVLFTHPLGQVCLICGASLLCAGIFFSVRTLDGLFDPPKPSAVTLSIRAGPEKKPRKNMWECLHAATALELCVALLDSGQSLTTSWIYSLCTLEPVTAHQHKVLELLAMGGARSAWQSMSDDMYLSPLATFLTQYTVKGSSLTTVLSGHAHQLRTEAENMSTSVSERALVIMAAPLTLCFLPAFLILGLIPSAIAMAIFH